VSLLKTATSRNFSKYNNLTLPQKINPRNLLSVTSSPSLNLETSFFILSSRTNYNLFSHTLFSHLFGFFIGRPSVILFSREIQLLTKLLDSNTISSSDKRIFFKSTNLRTSWVRKIGVMSEILKKHNSRNVRTGVRTNPSQLTQHFWSYLWRSDSFLDLPRFQLTGSITNKTLKPYHYVDYALPKIYKKWKRRRRKTFLKTDYSLSTQKRFLKNVSKLRLLTNINRFDTLVKNYLNLTLHTKNNLNNSFYTPKRVLRLKPRTKSFRNKTYKKSLKSFFRIPNGFKKRVPDHRHSSFLKLFSALTSSAQFFQMNRPRSEHNRRLYSPKNITVGSSVKLSQIFSRVPTTHTLSYTQFYTQKVSRTSIPKSFISQTPTDAPSVFNSSQFSTLFNLWSKKNSLGLPVFSKERKLNILSRKKYTQRRLLNMEKYTPTRKLLATVLKFNLGKYKDYFLGLMRLKSHEFSKIDENKKTKQKIKNQKLINFTKSYGVSSLRLFFNDSVPSDLFSYLYIYLFRHSYLYTRAPLFTYGGGCSLRFDTRETQMKLSRLHNNSLYLLKSLIKEPDNTNPTPQFADKIFKIRYGKLLGSRKRVSEHGYELKTRKVRNIRKRNVSFTIKKKGKTLLCYATRFRMLTKQFNKKTNIALSPFFSFVRRASYGVNSRLPKRRFVLKRTTPTMRLRIKRRVHMSSKLSFKLFTEKETRTTFSLKTFKSKSLVHKGSHFLPGLKLKSLNRVLTNFKNSLMLTQLSSIYKNTKNATSHVQYNYRFLNSTSLQSFRRGPYFLIQFLSILKTLPEVHLMAKKKFFYSDPFNFVDYKRLKKTVFRRLIMQRSKMLKSPFKFTGRGLSYLNPNSKLSHLFDYKNSPFLYKHSSIRSSIFNYKTHYRLFFGRMKPYYDYRSGDTIDTPTFIRKIRFKPGYQRMWRHERNVFKETFKLTHRYQYRLTPKIQLMYYPTRYTILKSSKFQLKLSYTLVLSRLASDQWTSDFLIDNKYVYLNGNLVTNGFTMIFPNDFLQLIVSLRFYILHRWLHMLAFQRFNSWLRRYYKTYRIKKQLFKDFTFRSLPDSVLNLQNSFHDVPKTMEVDYFTLSSFVLYSSKEYNLTHPLPINVFRLYVINMYNWKYLT
jgi:hypothetical protein